MAIWVISAKVVGALEGLAVVSGNFEDGAVVEGAGVSFGSSLVVSKGSSGFTVSSIS